MPVHNAYSSAHSAFWPVFGQADEIFFYYSSFSYNGDILHLTPPIGKKAFNKNTMALNKNKALYSTFCSHFTSRPK